MTLFVEYVKQIDAILEGKLASVLDEERIVKLMKVFKDMDADTKINVVSFASLAFDQEKLIGRINEDWKQFDKANDKQSALSAFASTYLFSSVVMPEDVAC